MIIGIMLILMGMVLYIADKRGKNEIELEKISTRESLIVGLSQVLAIIPGVSRSGITMSAGRFSGITRESSAKFTFLMSAPIILADGLYHARELVHTQISTIPFVTAIVTSAIVGALSIGFLLSYLKRKGFGIFAVYRFAFGAFIILLFCIRGGR